VTCIVASVSSPPSDPSAAKALARVAEELAALRASVESLAQRLGELVAENRDLRAQLGQSEGARADLRAQTEHMIELLAHSRRELRALQDEAGGRPADPASG
jgi:septal ring factor EnvC (AmiA/AmiB activator)